MNVSNTKRVINRLLSDSLRCSYQNQPEKIAVIEADESYTYSDLYLQSTQLAHRLNERGLSKGDRVAIFLDNSWQTIVSIYATMYAGGVFVVINPQTKAGKLQYILEDCESKVLITARKYKKVVSPAINNNSFLSAILIKNYEQGCFSTDIPCEAFDGSEQRAPLDLVRVIPTDLAALIYTSGSTGFPKGVMQTHQSMFFTAWSLIEYLRMDENDRIFLVLPIAFDYGLYQVLMSVNLGATIILEQSFAYPAKIYTRIEETQPTVFPAVPTMYAHMIAAYQREPISFPSIKTITNTAAALHVDSVPWLHKIFPNALIFKMYGLTECKRVCYLEPELIDEKTSSVGKAIPGTETFLLSEDGKPVAANEPGILHVRGPHVMAGYWHQPERTEKMLVDGNLPGEKVLCTHDIFKMDDEGFLYFVSRSDDIIKSKGEKVSPTEVENILLKLESVLEAAVVGIADKTSGQSIAAFIVSEDKNNQNSNKIRMHCNNNMESFMVPSFIIFIDEMPKSPNGKIDKKRLVKKAEAANTNKRS